MSGISGISSAANLFQSLSSNTDMKGILGQHHGGGRHKGGEVSLLDTSSAVTDASSATNGSSPGSDLASTFLDALQSATAAATGITINQLG